MLDVEIACRKPFAGRGPRALFVIAATALMSGITAPSLLAQDGYPKTVALTFDDLPANTLRGPEAYAGILRPITETLRRTQVPAIGFVNEDKLYDNGQLDSTRLTVLTTWLDAGLPLGNHGFQHLDLHTTPLTAYLDAIDRGGLITSRLLMARGRRLTYYRHPFLHTGRSVAVRDSVSAHLARRGMRVAPVTIDNHEWIFARAYERALDCPNRTFANTIGDLYVTYMDSVTGYYEAQARSLLGREIPQILLLHANRLNADYLPELITVYRQRGYAFIAIDEALTDPVFASRDTYAGPAGITWIHRWALTAGLRGEVFAGEPDAPAIVRRAYDDPRGLPECQGRSRG